VSLRQTGGTAFQCHHLRCEPLPPQSLQEVHLLATTSARNQGGRSAAIGNPRSDMRSVNGKTSTNRIDDDWIDLDEPPKKSDAGEVFLRLPRPNGDELRVTRMTFGGQLRTSVRIWYRKTDGEWAPGKQGIALHDDEVAQVAKALAQLGDDHSDQEDRA